MYSLTCVEGYRTPIREEIYVLDIIPLSSGPVTISSDQALSAFNPAALSRGPVKSWQTNHGNITCAEGFDLGGAVVCTAGEDGSVSMWDLRLEEQQAQVARLTGACCGTSGFLYEYIQANFAQYRQLYPNSVIGLLKCRVFRCGWHRTAAQSSIYINMVSGRERYPVVYVARRSSALRDVRSTPTSRHQYKEVHSDDITEVSHFYYYH